MSCKPFWIAVLGVCFCACSDSLTFKDLETQRRSKAILNGRNDTAHPAVGKLKAFKTYNPQTFMACTATLIGKKTVLTAAHCLWETDNVVFQLGSSYYYAASWSYHPQFTYEQINTYDVGVVILSQEITFIPAVPLSKTAPSIGEEITLVGFGDTSTGADNWGVKRATQNTISAMTSRSFSYKGSSGSHGNICDGDSGGPSFRLQENQEVLVGIHSTATNPCGEAGDDIRVDAFYRWIAEKANGDLVELDTIPPAIQYNPSLEAMTLGPNFSLDLTVTDSGSGLASINLYLDGVYINSAKESPASFRLEKIAEGKHTIRIVAQDRVKNMSSKELAIEVKAAALPQENAPSVKGAVPPPGGSTAAEAPAPRRKGHEGELGVTCSEKGDCLSALCLTDFRIAKKYCSQPCAQAELCPEGYECRASEGSTACVLKWTSVNNVDELAYKINDENKILVGACNLSPRTPQSPWELLAVWAVLSWLFCRGALGQRNRRVRRPGRDAAQ
jgi:V8-like Glu-specific endopeptidase